MKRTAIMFGTIVCMGFAACASAQQQAAGKDKVDANKVETVNDWAKRKGATEVWVNNPQAPRGQTAAAVNRNPSPAATSGAEPVKQIASSGKPAKPRHSGKAKKKRIRPHAPPAQPAADAQ